MAYRGKVALVTGGGSGMGRLACQLFARAGAKVAALDVNEQGLADTAAGHEGIRVFRVDITDADAVRTVVDEVEKTLGPIDRVYNCAAIMPYSKILEQDPAVQHRIMNININGLINVAHATVGRMVARKRGDFVSFGSMAGVMPTMMTGAYSSSKAAVNMYSEILYHENINSGVRFACVCPPVVNTPLLEQGRGAWPKMLDSGTTLQPQDVLDAIEQSLEKGEFWVFPGKHSRQGYILRRLFPGLLWKQVHKVEGF